MILADLGWAPLDRLLADGPGALAAILVGVLLVALVAALVLVVLARRGRRRESREIVRLLEEMRSGRARTRIELDDRSPFAPIAEAVNRLGQDLALRWSRAETASEGFHALQEAARGYAIVATDGDGDVRSFSPGAIHLFGWDEDAVVGRNASLLFDDVSWKDLLPKLARRSLRERGVETRAILIRKDGSKFHARVTVRLLRGHGEDHPGFLLVVQDVTEQVKTETELKEAETRSRRILEDLPGGVALVQDGRIVYANDAIRDLLEIGDVETTGFPLRERIGTKDVLLVEDALARLGAGAGEPHFEASVGLRDAAGRPGTEARLVASPHAHEGRPAVLVTLRDETRERRAARTLAAEAGRLDAVIDAWSDGVVVLEDEPGGARVRLANHAFLGAFQLERGQVAGATEDRLAQLLRVRGAGGAEIAACLESASREPVSVVASFDGRTLEVTARAFGDSAGDVRGRILAVRDVTEQTATAGERADETERWRGRYDESEASLTQLRALHDDLEARRAEAERLNQELRTLDAMKSDLLANVSHELQTPLVSIRGYTEMILKGRLGTINDEQRQGLSLSLRNIDRLIAMIDNLLAFAKMDRGAATMTLEAFPVTPVVDEAQALLRERIEARHITVTRQLPDPPFVIRADRDKILQVFVNLLSNAVKFNRDGGSIDVHARLGKPGYAVVDVRDTGPGIAKDDLEKIFDRFYQAGDRSPHEREGTGIGLAIVRNILRLHGCVIHASSTVGSGTTFTFTLPLAAEGALPAEPPVEPAAPPAPPPVAERRGQVADAPERPRLRIIRRS